MTRVRWLAAKWPLSMRAIGVKMKAAEFKPGSTDGFLVERVRDSSIDGQYIEKITSEETLIDPFGGEERLRRTEYRRTNFRLDTVFPQIELRNSPRSLLGFTSRLGEINNLALTILPIDVDVGSWVELFLATFKTRTVLDAILAGNIKFNDGVNGKLFLKGGNAIQQTLKQIIGGRRHQIEKAFVKFETGSKWNTIQFGKDCSVRLSGDRTDDVLELLQSTLIAACS